MNSEKSRIDIGSLRRLSIASRTKNEIYLDQAHDFLEHMIRDPHILDLHGLNRKPGRYVPNILFGDENLSLLAIVWAPGARTSIHDHHCTCCFGVLAGRLKEERYRLMDGTLASSVNESVCEPGFIRCMVPSGPNLHRMVNDTDIEAVSLHLYGFNHQTAVSSIAQEYSVAMD